MVTTVDCRIQVSHTVWSQQWTVIFRCHTLCGHNNGLSYSGVTRCGRNSGLSYSGVTHCVVTTMDCCIQVSHTVWSQQWTVVFRCHTLCGRNSGLSYSGVTHCVVATMDCRIQVSHTVWSQQWTVVFRCHTLCGRNNRPCEHTTRSCTMWTCCRPWTMWTYYQTLSHVDILPDLVP